MREFGTQGPVNSKDHYVVSRSAELADYINRVKHGRYIVLFAPRQSGKTTFFQEVLKTLADDANVYFSIQLNFEMYKNYTPGAFYADLLEDIREEIEEGLASRNLIPSPELLQFLEHTQMTSHAAMRRFFRQLPRMLMDELSTRVPPRLALLIDEFDGIPQTAVSDFLHTLRRIYLTGREVRSPYSVGIVGVKNITQLNYDSSISPFNIQDDFTLPNFTAAQVQELLAQYTDEVGQAFAPEVVDLLHKQTAGQPFLVNRCAQILNPIYLHCIIQAFRPLINGLEDQYFPKEGPIDFTGYIASTGRIQMHTLINNFKDFIARAGLRILQVPDTPKEFIGQYLLFAYLDEFVKIVHATMRLEVPTGRGRADIIISHNRQQYIIETKIWRNEQHYQVGKQQLAVYLKSEGATEGYYIVFDHRENPKPQLETDTLDGLTIRSYVIPVMQKRPSEIKSESRSS